jgi:Smg protein
MRVYTFAEQQQLGADCLGFLQFLEDAGKLSTQMREVVIDRAMAVSYQPVTLDDLKIIVLMVYWSVGLEPDALILDELCDAPDRVAH